METKLMEKIKNLLREFKIEIERVEESLDCRVMENLCVHGMFIYEIKKNKKVQQLLALSIVVAWV